ncbi:PQQ-binding-like beta-propeller repeat protein [Nonomuraea sp. NPDC046802]|uniref:outer membrane protein assembly factor BamB family protein n=1 Tax=Nonomuraea sp. NPDC046802 TaxID=3154919 RepID=UPI0033BFCA2D
MRWGWFGSGVVLTGLSAAGWGYALRWSVFDEPWAPAGIGLLLALGLLVLLVVKLVRLPRESDGPEHGIGPEAHAQRSVRVWAGRAAVVTGVFALDSLVRAYRTFAGGLPELGEVLFGVGMTLMTVGLVLLATTRNDLVVPSFRGMGGGVAVALVPLLAGSLVVEILPVEAVTADRPAEVAVPTTLSKVAWQWKRPDGAPIKAMAVAGGHVIVAIGDGVAALDPRTGRERWHYRRPGASVGMHVAPDRATVVLALVPGDGAQASRNRMAVLDAYTGRVRFEYAGERRWRDERTVLTSSGYVTTDDAGRLKSWDLSGASEPAWEYIMPSGCRPDFGVMGSSTVALRDVIAVVARCQDGVVVTGLNPTDGTEKWRYDYKSDESLLFINAAPSDDRSAMNLIVDTSREGVSYNGTEAKKNVILEQGTGKVLSEETRRSLLATHFTTEGYLSLPTYDGGRGEYRWHPYDGSAPNTAAMEVRDLNKDTQPVRYMALKDSVAVAEVSTTTPTTVTVTTHVAPWGTTSATNISFDLNAPESEGRGPMLLLPAAGAVVFGYGGSNTLVGLV